MSRQIAMPNFQKIKCRHKNVSIYSRCESLGNSAFRYYRVKQCLACGKIREEPGFDTYNTLTPLHLKTIKTNGFCDSCSDKEDKNNSGGN
jgi:hypothetical protein